MSEQLYRCENADRCGVGDICGRSQPHEMTFFCDTVAKNGFAKCIQGSKCIPVTTEPKPQDPDVVLAREYVMNHTFHNQLCKCDGCDLLLRLAEKVEGMK